MPFLIGQAVVIASGELARRQGTVVAPVDDDRSAGSILMVGGDPSLAVYISTVINREQVVIRVSPDLLRKSDRGREAGC